jgi:hydroxymethylpyrimidine pyrophosphatase-like HAD family hydrolase
MNLPERDSASSGCDEHPLLFVDLDGTLVSNDTLHASLWRLVLRRPWTALWLPFWVFGGKAYFKDRVAIVATDLLGPLPYRDEVLRYVQAEVGAGRRVVLATAANFRIADKVAAELGLFTAVMASDRNLNLSGERKLAKIQTYCDGRPFAYMGDHRNDIPIWLAAQRAIVVGSANHLCEQIATVPDVVVLTPDPEPQLRK